jgi:hypothetical protein
MLNKALQWTAGFAGPFVPAQRPAATELGCWAKK